MKYILFLVIILTAISGCAENGYATDTIARVVFLEFDGCLDEDGYNGWFIQLTNDHPTDDARNSYQIRDDMVETAQHYAETKQLVKLQVKGSKWDSDCDRIELIEKV